LLSGILISDKKPDCMTHFSGFLIQCVRDKYLINVHILCLTPRVKKSDLISFNMNFIHVQAEYQCQ